MTCNCKNVQGQVNPRFFIFVRAWIGIPFMALTICLCGCIVPLPDEVSAGHRYSRESLLFLDAPGTTREDVISTLGPPLLESTNHLTLIYTWGQTPRFYFMPPEQIGPVPLGTHPAVVYGDEYHYCLFIAYDRDKQIVDYAVRKPGSRGFEEACADWSRERRAK